MHRNDYLCWDVNILGIADKEETCLKIYSDTKKQM